ncbi:MAG TPA: hypothetical protein VFV38_48370 [Ktedonobacteraceae bacterium]|nr:hypothetical protein [Ktedonobacteraceae bacterium]
MSRKTPAPFKNNQETKLLILPKIPQQYYWHLRKTVQRGKVVLLCSANVWTDKRVGKDDKEYLPVSQISWRAFLLAH